MENEEGGKPWMPDALSSECLLCSSKFTLTRRRHHCRVCKRLVCGSCSSNELNIPQHPSSSSSTTDTVTSGVGSGPHQSANVTMSLQRCCDECFIKLGEGEQAMGLRQLVRARSTGPLFLRVWLGRASGLAGVDTWEEGAAPASTLGGGAKASWYCVLRLNKEVVGQTAPQPYRQPWAVFNESLKVRVPPAVGTLLLGGVGSLHLAVDVMEKGRNVLLGTTRVPLSYALKGGPPSSQGDDICARLIDPNTSMDAGRIVLRVACLDASSQLKDSGRPPLSLLSLYPPGSPLFPHLFLKTLNGKVVPENEKVVEIFEEAQLSIKNSRVQRTRHGRLIVTSHRLLHVCHSEASTLSSATAADLPSQLPFACLASITVKGGKAFRGSTPVLEVSCKNQLTYLYHVQPPPPPNQPEASSYYSPHHDSISTTTTTTSSVTSSFGDLMSASPPPPPTSEVLEQLLARLRAVQEEVLWRISEDDFAFPEGRSRFYMTPEHDKKAKDEKEGGKAATTGGSQEASHRNGGGAASEVVPSSDLDLIAEFNRQGVRDNPLWRISHVNKGYKLCRTYPEVLLVPVSVTDAELIKAAEFRSKARIPVITWICPVTGAALTRSSQPLTGLTNSANPSDDKLLLAIRATAYIGHAMGEKFACVDLIEASICEDDSAWTEVVTSAPPQDEEGGVGGDAARGLMGNGASGSEEPNGGGRDDDKDDATQKDEGGAFHLSEAPFIPTNAAEGMEALAASIEGQFYYDAEGHHDHHGPESSSGMMGSPFDEILMPQQQGVSHGGGPQHPDPILRILDARPMLSSMGNALMGKGSEVISRLGGEASTTLEYLSVANIHHMRESYMALLAACHEHADEAFFANLHESRWLHHVSSLLKGAVTVARYLESGDPVLVHCSDGWDRTSQLCALSQLMLDPYYRTIEGFRVLVEKDFCAFGYQFRSRSGTDSESSPILVQFLDACYQLLRQFPHAFQFGERLLLLLAEAVYSRWFRNFLYDSDAERHAALQDDFTTVGGPGQAPYSVWDVVQADPDAYRNVLYDPHGSSSSSGQGGECRGRKGSLQHLRPRPDVARLSLWRELYMRDHMRFVAERGRSRLTREQALEKRVLLLEAQLGQGGIMTPLEAREAQERVRQITKLAEQIQEKATFVEDLFVSLREPTHHVARQAVHLPPHVARHSRLVGNHHAASPQLSSSGKGAKHGGVGSPLMHSSRAPLRNTTAGGETTRRGSI